MQQLYLPYSPVRNYIIFSILSTALACQLQQQLKSSTKEVATQYMLLLQKTYCVSIFEKGCVCH